MGASSDGRPYKRCRGRSLWRGREVCRMAKARHVVTSHRRIVDLNPVCALCIADDAAYGDMGLNFGQYALFCILVRDDHGPTNID